MTGFAWAGGAVGIGVNLTRSLESGRVVWELAEDVTYQLALKSGQALTFTIPKGSLTDGASVPAGLRWLVPPVQYPTFLPCALHDLLWTQHQAEKAARLTATWSRATIDHVFREALRAEGVGRLKRWAMWAAVRLQALWTDDV